MADTSSTSALRQAADRARTSPYMEPPRCPQCGDTMTQGHTHAAQTIAPAIQVPQSEATPFTLDK